MEPGECLAGGVEGALERGDADGVLGRGGTDGGLVRGICNGTPPGGVAAWLIIVRSSAGAVGVPGSAALAAYIVGAVPLTALGDAGPVGPSAMMVGELGCAMGCRALARWVREPNGCDATGGVLAEATGRTEGAGKPNMVREPCLGTPPGASGTARPHAPHSVAVAATAIPQNGHGRFGTLIFLHNHGTASVRVGQTNIVCNGVRRRSGPIPQQLLSFDEAVLRATDADTGASALLAAGHLVMSRSLKYHRPRSAFCLEGHCAGCCARIDGQPNMRLCQVPAREMHAASTQNALRVGSTDVLEIADWFFADGLDHHTLMTSTRLGNFVAERVVRQLSGVGKLPTESAAYLPPEQRTCDVCVVGGGAAGLAVAEALGDVTVLVIDDQLTPGGSWHGEKSVAPHASANVLSRTTLLGAMVDERRTLIASSPTRLVRIQAEHVVWATGGTPQLVPFGNNDRPGVMATRAVGRLFFQHHIVPGDAICFVETMPTPPTLLRALASEGVHIECVAAADVAHVTGTEWVQAVVLTDGRVIDCDLVGISTPAAPASEGPRQFGAQVRFDAASGGFVVITDAEGRTNAANHWAVGDVCGYVGPVRAAAAGTALGRRLRAIVRGAA